jgi:HSP20 family protein
MERSSGSFYRRQPLPEGTKPEQIQATFQDGVLEVTAPKPVEKKPELQKIPVVTK